MLFSSEMPRAIRNTPITLDPPINPGVLDMSFLELRVRRKTPNSTST
jgi:hypothetical protein